MITFREIDKSNYMECICLKVKDEQRGFVADNARSLADARKILPSLFRPWQILRS